MRIFKLSYPDGPELWLSTFGARILKLIVKNKEGQRINVHRYPKDLNHYYTKEQYCGPVIGPIANRVKDGIAKIGEENFQMERNEQLNTLHSGFKGLHRHIWSIKERTPSKVILTTTIDHLEDHLPGNRNFEICFELTQNKLLINYKATTDLQTAINMTVHPFFNLSASKNLDDHFFWLDAKQITQVEKDLVPTGTLLDTPNTNYDFTQSRQLPDDTIDHNYVLNQPRNFENPAAVVRAEKSGIEMKFYCTQPGLQFYTGTSGFFAIEPQHFPDSLNHAHFPSIELSSDQVYDHSMIFAFHEIE